MLMSCRTADEGAFDLSDSMAMLSNFAACPRLLGEITPFLGDFQPSIFVVWAFH